MAAALKRMLVVALAALSPALFAAPCATGTLADYEMLASCEIGDLTFANFDSLDDLPAGATPLPSTAITVTPFLLLGDAALTLTFDATSQVGESRSALIRFQVLPGLGFSLTGARLSMVSSVAGDAIAIVVEDLCADGAFGALPPGGCTGTPDALITAMTDLISDIDVGTTFSATSLDVTVNPIVDGGFSGSATLSSATLLFLTNATPGAVPEPSTLLLAAAVLLFAALARRRRSAARR